MFGTKDSIEADLNKHFSRFEDPLWDEDESKTKIIEVKRVSSKSFDKHSWKILENSKIIAVITDDYLSQKQINFLLSPEGITFIINTFKSGIRKATKIKELVKNANKSYARKNKSSE